MSVIQIREAVRSGARTVIGLAGISGSGKTHTALQLAYGMANYNAKKIGLLDAENKRGSLYADILRDESGAVQRFLVGDLEPPFTPQRYIDAILEFQAADVEVLVIDSASHEWEGAGGCEEIAHAANPRLPDWATAKREHKRFMNALLQSNMHVIACLRAREKVKIHKVNGKTEIEPLGVLPICEKNFMFELTASLMMWKEGKAQQVVKCPEELRTVLGRGEGYLTAKDGKALRDWIDHGIALDPEVEKARNTLRTITEQGVDTYRQAWEKTPKRIKKILDADGTHKTLKAAAEAYDAQRTASKLGGAQLADLNNEVLAGE
jgi:hypothetical protein